jgi:WD40 repeat protein
MISFHPDNPDPAYMWYFRSFSFGRDIPKVSSRRSWGATCSVCSNRSAGVQFHVKCSTSAGILILRSDNTKCSKNCASHPDDSVKVWDPEPRCFSVLVPLTHLIGRTVRAVGRYMRNRFLQRGYTFSDTGSILKSQISWAV